MSCARNISAALRRTRVPRPRLSFRPVLPSPLATVRTFSVTTTIRSGQVKYTSDAYPNIKRDSNFAEVTADEPNDTVTELDDYEDWLGHTWNHPSLDRDLSTVVTAGGRVVAFAMAYTDGATRYLSAMTGTVRAHRGRGLAKAAKIHSLRRARAAGFRDAFTNNDAENKPMLAVNAWFGYEPRTSEVRHVRHLI